MDLVMPRLDGIAATRRIKALGTGIQVIALTSFAEDDKVFPAIQAGASSYLLKDVSPDALVEAIRAVHRGEARLHPDVMRKLMEQVARQPKAGEASQRSATYPAGRMRSSAWWPRGRAIARSPRSWSSAKRPPRRTSATSSANSGLDDRTQMAIYAIKNGLVDQDKA